jgi:hypothetical protein
VYNKKVLWVKSITPLASPVAILVIGHGLIVIGTSGYRLFSEYSQAAQNPPAGGENRGSNSSSSSQKPTLSQTKDAVRKAQDRVGGSLPKGAPLRLGSCLTNHSLQSSLLRY